MTIRLHGNASRTLLYALVIVMVAAVYIPALRGAFISDDNDLIRARQAILVRSDGWRDVIRHGFWWESGNEAANPRLYRPWTSLTYWLDYQVGGLSPTAFRVSNYVVHLANTALIAVVLSGYVGTATALWIAALCGVAPVGLTSVGWIGGRTDLWAMFFVLIFLWLFGRALRSGSIPALIGAALTYFLALCSKEVAVAVPIVAWTLESVFRTDKSARPRRLAFTWQLAGVLVPLIVFLGLRRHAIAGETSTVIMPSFFDTLPSLAEQYLRTALHCLFSTHYSFGSELIWSRLGARGLGFIAGWIVFLVLIATVVFGLIAKRPWAAGGAWFGLMLFPAYGTGQAWAPVVDFYAYAALPGFWLFLIEGLGDAAQRISVPVHDFKVVRNYVLCALILVSGVMTASRLPILHTDFRLLTKIVEYEPRAVGTMIRLAASYLDQGDMDQGIYWLNRALEVRPNDWEIHSRLASLHLKRHDLQSAARHVDALAELAPDQMEAQAVIARFYYDAGHCAESAQTYRTALRLGEPSAEIWFNYGLALLCNHEDSAAVQVFSDVARREPSWAEASNNLGIAYENLGELDRAADGYREAVKRDPRQALSWESLSRVLLQMGRSDEARLAALRCLQLQPPAERVESLKSEFKAAGIAL